LTDIDLTDRELELLANVHKGSALWMPCPENIPQLMAYLSPADVLGYGGAAGGGKTDLVLGKALMQHQVSGIFRRHGTEMTAILDRLTQLIGTRDGYNGQEHIWRFPKRGQQIEFGSTPHLGDENKYQGRPHDLLAMDEAANFFESQVRFLTTWLRNASDPSQHCQLLLTFNPPQDAEGRWIIDFFAPWLDLKHPLPAEPGELRYFQMQLDGKEIEVPRDAPPITMLDKLIYPKSRTFIPSRVSDNPYLGDTYLAQLASLPEPLRSQMLHGDFHAGTEDSEWQVIPTAWVEAAQARWQPRPVKTEMDSLGVDVARGGKDNTIFMPRHDNWYDEPIVYPGTQTPDGASVAGLAVTHLRDRAVIHIDVIGVGASPYDFLKKHYQTVAVDGRRTAPGTDKSGVLTFSNERTHDWWRMREDLDPQNNKNVQLPPDRQLLLDLCAPLWKPQGKMIKVESREDIIKRIGRSPDWGSACIYARRNTPKNHIIDQSQGGGFGDYDPTGGH